MYKRINIYEFCDLMKDDKFSNFSHDALLAIFDHIEQKEEEIGEEMEFSRADIRTLYSEYTTENEAIENANYDPTGWNDGKFISLPGGGFVVVES